jgi:hypothetical protein
MGVFDDKKFEQLDWMTQITETIESELNTLLAKLPDRIEFSAERVGEYVRESSYFSIQVDGIVRDLVTMAGGDLSWEEEAKLAKCFKFDGNSEVEFNAETGQLSGTIVMVKTVPTLSDEELQVFMGVRGMRTVRDFDLGDAENWNLERINEILDILGTCDDEKRNRSYRKKMRRIEARLKTIFTTNEWRIRDMELADKVGVWIVKYIEYGHLPALINLSKLKIMTHSNMPIYSMEEEK